MMLIYDDEDCLKITQTFDFGFLSDSQEFELSAF